MSVIVIVSKEARKSLASTLRGPVNLVMDLRVAHERWGRSSNPVLNGTTLHYSRPADIVKPLHDAAAEKIREYRADYNNHPSNSISDHPTLFPPC
jgi:hypothetical protein